MNRRTLLKRGLFGGALLALGGTALFLAPTREQSPPTRPLLALEPRSFQVLVAVASRMVTAPGADAVAIAHAVDEAVSYFAPESQKDVSTLLLLFENALPGLLLDGRVAPFTRLSPASQDAVLDAWRTSRLALRRTGYHALRKLCLGAHYEQQASWAPLGYAPPFGLNGMAYDDSKLGSPEYVPPVSPHAPSEGDAGAKKDAP